MCFSFCRSCKGLHSGSQSLHESNLPGDGGRAHTGFSLRGSKSEPERNLLWKKYQQVPGQGDAQHGKHSPSEKHAGRRSGKSVCTDDLMMNQVSSSVKIMLFADDTNIFCSDDS